MRKLADSDFLVGLFSEQDAHHGRAVDILKNEMESGSSLFVTNLVLQETATVLAHRVGMDAVRLFYEKLPKLQWKIMRVDEKTEDLSWSILIKQTKKGCSFVDCANLAVIELNKFTGILSFDKFDPKDIRLD